MNIKESKQRFIGKIRSVLKHDYKIVFPSLSVCLKIFEKGTLASATIVKAIIYVQ